MKAVVKIGKGKNGVCYMDMPEPYPGDYDVKIEIYAAGICGTDLHIYKDEYLCNPPVIMGHEFSGKIVDTGKHVTSFSAGDRVVSLTAVETCNRCRYCREGLIMLCDKRKSIGSGLNGVFTEYIVVPESTLLRIPDNIDLEEAALFEPLSCVVRSVLEMSRITSGDRVLISGPGTIGQLALQIAVSAGAEVSVCGTSADINRLLLADKLGAVKTFITKVDDSAEDITERAGGDYFDIAFECAGAMASADNCLRLLRKNGQYIQVGLFGRPILFDLDLALTKEIDIVSGFATKMSSWERAVRLTAAGKLKLKPLISDVLPLYEWEAAFSKALRREGFKILLRPIEKG